MVRAKVTFPPLPNHQSEMMASLLNENRPGRMSSVKFRRTTTSQALMEHTQGAGRDVGYHHPGRREGGFARDMFPGTAKTKPTQARGRPFTAMGMRRWYCPGSGGHDLGTSMSCSPPSSFATGRATMARNHACAPCSQVRPSFGRRGSPGSSRCPDRLQPPESVGREHFSPVTLRQAQRSGAGEGSLGSQTITHGQKNRA